MDVGYHTLSDFRSQQAKVIDGLITQVLGLLMQQDLVDLSRVAQDGTRVRASAGASSFRREQTLAALIEAREHLEAVTREATDPAISTRRAAAAQARRSRAPGPAGGGPATSARGNRNEEAQRRQGRHGPCVHHRPGGAGHEDGRRGIPSRFQHSSRRRRIRLASSWESTSAIGAATWGQTTPMLDQIEKRTGVRPDEMLIDGGYAQHDAIDHAVEHGTTVYAPLPAARGRQSRSTCPHAGDSAAVGAWRKRMATDEAKTIYKQRAATAETVNADAKQHRGLDSLPLRGREKVLGSAYLFALTYNILRLLSIGSS